MKMLVIGSSGQVARALQAGEAGMTVVAVGRPDLDLEQPDTLVRAIEAHAPDIIASVGAYTAVDLAESEPEKARRINALGPEAIARACAERRLPVIHVSTDYVFAGEKAAPYVETDPTVPRTVYGRTKLEGEQRVAAAAPQHVILRTAWVYSDQGKNFPRTMLRLAKVRPELGVVDDQHGCPTYAPDLAEAICSVARRIGEGRGVWGVFHAAGEGETTWRGFAEEVFTLSAKRGGPTAVVKALTTAEYPTPAHRPANSRLDCSRLAASYGVRLRPWREALADCIARLADSRFDVG
ncbi:MAG: dTDP-4-dehydrorhamnose reductase [Alphaproteobacteria bacterium]